MRGARQLLALAALLAGLALPGAVVPAEESLELGRIFLTPAERRLLDQRRLRPALNGEGLPQDLLPGRPAPAQRLVMNGLVRRGREAPVVWLNGRRADGEQTDARIEGKPDRQQRVTVESSGNGTRRLKPGQVWDLETGRVSECMNCTVPPAPAAPPATPATPVAPVPTTAQAAP